MQVQKWSLYVSVLCDSEFGVNKSKGFIKVGVGGGGGGG